MSDTSSADAQALRVRPFHVVLNSGSGHEDAQEAARTIAACFERAGRTHTLYRVGDGSDVEDAARRAVERARGDGGVVIAAGGDGTLNTVAQAVLGSGCAFGVIPQGTFNYFARTHGIPTDTAEASAALLDAQLRPVHVGFVNGRLFLVNASLGLYPEALEVREEQKQRHGRRRSVAIWAALITVLRGHHPMRIRLIQGGAVHEVRTLTLFVGVNQLQLEQMGLAAANTSFADETLTAVILKPVSTPRLLWAIVKGAAGQLGRVRGVDHFRFSTLTVVPANPAVRRCKVATDGETGWMIPPLEFRFAPEPLRLLVPREPSRRE